MSALTLDDIRAIVRFRGDFRNTIRFPDASVNAEIQASFAEFYELVADTNEGYWDTVGAVTTTANVAFVALPADAWRIRAAERLDGIDPIALDFVGVMDRNRYGMSTGRPCAVRPSARGLELYPTPDATYTVNVYYTPRAPALADAVAREYYNGWEEMVVYSTLIRLAENEERDTTEWQNRVDRQAARIKGGASQRKAAEPDYIPLFDGGGDIDRDERWR
jgi:hypothetical protein